MNPKEVNLEVLKNLDLLRSRIRIEEGHLKMTPPSVERVKKEGLVEGLRLAERIVDGGETSEREG
jgi:hypothetical protein